MKPISQMTDDELYAEINTWPSDAGQCAEPAAFRASPFSAEAPSPAVFNNASLLTVTNPERLLGLTPREVIELVKANGACSGVMHTLQVAANRGAGGWGEILRSPHMFGWFQWLAYNVDGVHPELQSMAEIIQQARMALESAHCERLRNIQTGRHYTVKCAAAARFERIHGAQRELLDHWAGELKMTPVEMYQELSRLSDKLNAAKDWGRENPDHELTQSELDALVADDEKPHIQKYLKAMRRSEENYRIANDNAAAFCMRDKEANAAHLVRRQSELQESLAQYLLVCSIQLEKVPSCHDVLDSLLSDD